ncbi:hypothetical protein [Paraburkholderia haematera]|uniref:Uncharacterized protein n=1 Tax=Paraburkholderia haematera TaxID=2793077 RepID=A0ABM8SLG7_9BURK|nr:hypothetical protein [Paraburkholderia haematera]CAE6817817.1 hypothetical protein R69888_05957 [Paraburkholderia haematera]
MYIAILVPTLQQTHIHSDAALALHSVKPHWLALSWQRIKALLPNPASNPASDSASNSASNSAS